jgi:hypothetical protein
MGVLVNPLHHYYREDHLQHVIGEMRKRGAPRIRAYFDGEVWHAREGTHRLRAAKALGIAPVIVAIPWWRSRAAIERARYRAIERAHNFDHVNVERMS